MQNGTARLEQVRSYLITGQYNLICELFATIQPYDQADIITLLNPEERQQVLNLFDDESLALIFEELDPDIVSEVVEQFGPERFSRILGEMAFDDAVDLLGELHEDEAEELLELMEADDAKDVKALLTHPENTAGGLMTNEYIALRKEWTVEDALQRLRELAPQAETIYYLYVTDAAGRLVGVASLRELIIAPPKALIGEIMSTNVISVMAGVDQEEVARIIEKYDFLAVPVVNKGGRIIGIVTVDDVIDVLEDEATEDISRLAAIQGIREVGDLRVSAHHAALKRLPWLVLLMFFGLISGNIIARFEHTLNAVVALAVFIPLIADMAGNTGTQALAVVVRGLALNEFKSRDVLWLLWREAGVGLIVGTVNGLLIAAVTWLWQGNPWLGFVIGLTLWVTLFVSTLSGAMVPLLLNKIRVDPAIASGPFITTINDIIGLTIYFTVATAFMGRLI
jgi:magnesium transporter